MVKQLGKIREVSLDFCRMVVFLMIFCNQTTAFFKVISVFSCAISTLLCKTGVPIFILTTGALLLDKQESIRKLLGKWKLRMAIVPVLISIVVCLHIIVRCIHYELALVEEFAHWTMTCIIDISCRCSYMGIMRSSTLSCLMVTRKTVEKEMLYILHLKDAIRP